MYCINKGVSLFRNIANRLSKRQINRWWYRNISKYFVKKILGEHRRMLEERIKNLDENNIIPHEDMDNSLLRRHQLVLLSMLNELNRICQKHHISYMLFAGTALGAVRHKGFIPWDDDLDILMFRPEYEKFLEIAPSELDSNLYYLQKEFSQHWPCFYSKLRKNNTTFIEKYHPKDRLMHQGVYIDIFPCDNLSDHKLVRKIQFYASKAIIAQSLYRRGYLTDSKKKKLAMYLCSCLPRKPLLALIRLEKASNSLMVHSFLGESSKYTKSVYFRKWMNETCLMQFEDGKFPVSMYYDELLTTLYGNYMVLPSESERKRKIHAIKIDLEHSYEKYLDWQAGQK
jgi:lipopolysaccharide cholinephosphotransferase